MFNIVGYGYRKDNPIQNKLLKSSEFGIKKDPAGQILFLTNDTSDGMSGAPVWIRRHKIHNGRIVVGIFVGGQNDASGKFIYNKTVFINEDVRKFIKNNWQ